MPSVPPLVAWYLAPHIARGVGYGFAARRIEKARRRFAVGAATFAGGVGYIASRFRKSKQGTRKSKSHSVTMKTPNYGPGTKRTFADMGTVTNATYQDAHTQTIRDKGQGYTQLSRTNLYYGKKLDKTEKKLKLIGARMQRVVERWQKVDETAKLGKFPLDYNTLGPDGNAQLPLYLFDLTCVPNHARAGDYTIAAGAGTTILNDIVWPFPMRRLMKETGGGRFYTDARSGRDHDNSGDKKEWLPERYPTSVRELMAHDACLIEDIDIRLMLYGATARPSRVYVELWQFTDDGVTPASEYGFYNAAGTVQFSTYAYGEPVNGDENADVWNNMWFSCTDGNLGNPIGKRGVKLSEKPYNVLYRREFEFQPIDMQEKDQTGHQEEVRFKIDMNKVVGFVNNPEIGGQIVTDELDNPNEWDIAGNQKVRCFTVPKGRVYLVIRGSVMERTNTEELQPTVSPSFDLVVRRKRSQLV